MRYYDSEGRKILLDLAKLCLKIPTGTETVEAQFNLIKQIHCWQRAGLGPKKLKRLIFVCGNYNLLKKWWK